MTRTIISIPALVLVMALLAPLFDRTPFTADPAAADLLQCMDSCIRHEGGNSAANKETCKSRCANVPSVTGGSQPGRRDSGSCMSTYKDCRESCGGNKACKRACKKALMRCQ